MVNKKLSINVFGLRYGKSQGLSVVDFARKTIRYQLMKRNFNTTKHSAGRNVSGICVFVILVHAVTFIC